MSDVSLRVVTVQAYGLPAIMTCQQVIFTVMEGLQNDVSLEVISGMEREDDEEFSHKVALWLITDDLCKTGFGKNDIGPSSKQNVLLEKGRAS